MEMEELKWLMLQINISIFFVIYFWRQDWRESNQINWFQSLEKKRGYCWGLGKKEEMNKKASEVVDQIVDAIHNGYVQFCQIGFVGKI